MGEFDTLLTGTATPFDPFPDTGMFRSSTAATGSPSDSAETRARRAATPAEQETAAADQGAARADRETAKAQREAARADREAAKAEREVARQLSMVIPDDIATLLAAAVELAGAELPGGPSAAQAPALLARLRGLTQLANVIDAAVAVTARAAENAQAAEFDGHTSIKSWMPGHLHVSQATASRVVRAGRTMEQLPRWAAAAAEGLVTADQTAVLAKAATPARLAAAADLGVDVHGDDGLDSTLLACATGSSPEVLPAVVKRLLDWIDPDGPEPDPTRNRELHLTPATDGGGSIHGRLDPAGFEKVATALTAYQQAGRVADDDRSHAQQMADALVQLADNALAAADTPMLRKHHAQIAATITAEDFLDPDVVAGAARLGSGQLVSNEMARQLACDSIITRVFLGPDGMPMNIGRAQRLVPAHIRKAAEARDGGCVFTGCPAPTWWCDAHHVREWIADHGETSAENTALLCERHHAKVHHGYSISWDPGEKRWRTYRESGAEIMTGYPPNTARAPR